MCDPTDITQQTPPLNEYERKALHEYHNDRHDDYYWKNGRPQKRRMMSSLRPNENHWGPLRKEIENLEGEPTAVPGSAENHIRRHGQDLELLLFTCPPGMLDAVNSAPHNPKASAAKTTI